MLRILLWAAGAIVAAHGFIHLMGFVAYWPLAHVAELPYKTALLSGRWEVGSGGMKLYGILWLIAALGFLLAVGGLAAHQPWWPSVMLGTSVLSTTLIALDWAPAFRGAIINALILAVTGLAYLLPNGLAPR
jgi:hypothetical protein